MPNLSLSNHTKTVNSALGMPQQSGSGTGERVVIELHPDGSMRTQSESGNAKQVLLGREFTAFVEQELAAFEREYQGYTEFGQRYQAFEEECTALREKYVAFERENRAALLQGFREFLRLGVKFGDNLEALEHLSKLLSGLGKGITRYYFCCLFRIAVSSSKLKVVTFFFEKEGSSNAIPNPAQLVGLKYKRGRNALHLALERFVSLSEKDPRGDTRSAIQVILMLIEAGADIYKQDEIGRTPFCRLSTLTPKMSPEVLCTSRGQRLKRYIQLFVEAVFLKDQQAYKLCSLDKEDMDWFHGLWDEVVRMKGCLSEHLLGPGFGHRYPYSLWHLCLGDDLEGLVKSVHPWPSQVELELALGKLKVAEKTPYFAARIVLNARSANALLDRIRRDVERVGGGLLSKLLEKSFTAETAHAIKSDTHGLKVITEAPTAIARIGTLFSKQSSERGLANVARGILPPVLGSSSLNGDTCSLKVAAEAPTAITGIGTLFSEQSSEQGSANVARRILPSVLSPPVLSSPFLLFYTDATVGAQPAQWDEIESSGAPTEKRAKLGSM